MEIRCNEFPQIDMVYGYHVTRIPQAIFQTIYTHLLKWYTKRLIYRTNHLQTDGILIEGNRLWISRSTSFKCNVRERAVYNKRACEIRITRERVTCEQDNMQRGLFK